MVLKRNANLLKLKNVRTVFSVKKHLLFYNIYKIISVKPYKKSLYAILTQK